MAGALIAQPINDDCNTATVIGASNLDNGQMNGNCVPLTGENNTGATGWEVAPGLYFTGNCWGGAIDSVVFYRFTAQGNSGFVEVTNGPATPHIAVIRFNVTCDINGAVELGCSSDGSPIVFDNQLTVGQVYYVVVGFVGNAQGTFNLCVFNPVPAPNDGCNGAIQLNNLDGSPCNVSLSNYYASTEGPDPACFPSGATRSVWFRFVAQGVSIASLFAQSSANAHIAVWDFSNTAPCNLNAGVILACQTNVTSTNAITLDNQLVIGNTYYLEVVFTNNAIQTSFGICLDNPVPAFNDMCANALPYPPNLLNDSTICHSVISGNTLNNDWPSTDVSQTFGCWNPNATYSVWFSFVAQGPDLDVTVNSTFGQASQIAVIEFTGGACTSNFLIWGCVTGGQEIDINNALTPGTTYYVAVGFANNGVGNYCINIFNPVPPPNDVPCSAINIPLNGTSLACASPLPTTVYANPEFSANSFPQSCQNVVENTVWYQFQMSDPNNVGFSINLTPISLTGNVSIVLFEAPICNVATSFQIAFFHCGPAPSMPLEWGPINDNSIYYLMVGSSEQGQGTFNLCISEIPPCFDNNFCNDPNGISSANVLDTPVSQNLGNCDPGGGPTFVCVDGCNEFADPEPGLTGCLGQLDPVVWYSFTTDQTANILNMTITSTDMDAPSVQLFLSQNGTCNPLTLVGLTQSNFGCMVGSNGQLIANSTSVGASTTYYIAIGGVNTFGGEFTLCISTLEASASCVTSSAIQVTSRSFGGSLQGPFFPGETLGICMRVNVFTVSTGAQNCQWFQGIVPVFGNGWDPGSFDGLGQPNNATLNGNTFPAPNVHNGGQFNWWPQVMYHHPHCFYNVGDFDGNGTLDICNGLYDIDCTGPGLPGGGPGCNGPCWNSSGPDDPGCGSLLPPGWFTAGVDGTCGGLIGWPAVDWGDGNTCNGPTGPWHFCFDLTIRPYPDCDQDATTRDLSLGFVSFADGEVGSWTGGPSVCGQDEPLFISLPGCCTDLTFLSDTHDPICSPGVFVWELDHPNATFWTWTVSAPSSIVGESGGQGPSGTVVINNLTNTGTTTEIVTYTFLGFDGGQCPSVIWDVDIIVYARITISMSPFQVCSTPTSPYTITPIIEGGDPSTYQYLWHDGSTSPTFQVFMPVQGQQYCLTVTDAVGCSGSRCVTLDVYTTFPVNIIAPVTGQCLVDGPIVLTGNATGGTGTFTFNWTGPSGQMLSGPVISAHESGNWVVTAQDSDGCIGKDSVTLNFWESPTVEIFPDDVAVCPGNTNPQQIQALVFGGQTPYTFQWQTPGGIITTPFIQVLLAGDYSVTVTDNNGCTADVYFEVFEQESPEVELPDYDPFCPDDLMLGVTITVPFDPSYRHYSWTGGPQGPNADSKTVYAPGTYSVTVSNEYGCRGIATVVIEEHPPAMYQMPDTIPFCQDNFVIVDAATGWIGGVPSQAQYQWDGPSTTGTDPVQFIFIEGYYFLTVTDNNGCTTTGEFYAIEEEFILIDIIGDSVICNGVPAVIMANEGFATYQWSSGQTTRIITVTEGDQYYYVTVSDGDGCFGRDSVYVPASSPSPSIAGQPVCSGDLATLDVGTWTSVLWSTGATTSSITTDTAGLFFVTVTDNFGCTNTASYTALVEDKPTPDIQGITSLCQGQVSILDAGGPYAGYMWSTGESTQTIMVNATGTYWVEVTNTAGCSETDTIVVTVHGLPTPAITGDTSICNNVDIVLDAGSGFTSYEWSNSGTGQTLSTNVPGTYSVTVTDAQGCTGVDQVIVLATAPAPTISGVAGVCAGGSSTLTATGGYVTYAWSSGQSTPDIPVNSTGTYIVTVTDQYGCQGTASHVFTAYPNPTPVITGSTTFCPNTSTTLDAGSYTSYQWSTGATTQTISVSTTSTVIVTVTDANGCTGTASLSVMESDVLVLNTVNPTICEGQSAVLSVGTFATYNWSNGATTPTITVTAPGIYGVTVTDAGCMGTGLITVTVNPQPFAVVTAAANACNMAANGSTVNFAALVTGGDTGGTWTEVTNSGASGTYPVLNFNGVPYGVYHFVYTTNSALSPCMDVSYDVFVTIGTSPVLVPAAAMCNDDDQLNLNTLIAPGSPGGGTWTIVSNPPGSSPAVITGGNMFNPINADAGTYIVQYQISGIPGNCPTTATQSILVHPEPDAGFPLAAAQVCVGEDSLIVLSQLIAGADPGGMWIETSAVPSTGGAFNSATATFRTTTQIPGTYTFMYVINGTAPCPNASTTVEVVVENVPVADAGSDASITCDVTSVVLGGSGTSTGPAFTYRWTTTNGTIVNPNVLNTTVTQGGTYTLTVRNTQTGCESSDDVVVAIVGDIPTGANLQVYSPLCEGDPPGSAQVLGVTGGTPPYSYSLNGGAPVANANYQNLAAGNYTLLITDALGCRYETQFSIGTANVLSGTLDGPVVVEFGDDAVFTLTITAGTADSIVWFVNGVPTCFGCDVLTFKPTEFTRIHVEVYDERDCMIEFDASLQVKRVRHLYVPNVFTPNGDNVNDYVTVFSNADIKEIRFFQVFSRWGEKVFEARGIQPNIPELGWNGHFKGEVLNPGVYVYHALIIYSDDVEESIKGDVTLLR